MTTTTFAEYSAQQEARNNIANAVLGHTYALCEALRHNGPDGYHYSLDSSGRKYHKVFMHIGDRRDSIHAFIDKKTGSVYKPANVKAPAKGERYNVLVINSREEMFEKCDWAGGYLYMR